MAAHEHLTAEEIAAILYAESHDLTEREVLLLADFVAGVGGVEQAQQAIESLGQLRRAA